MLIDVDGIGMYVTCERMWWLARIEDHLPGDVLPQATQQMAARRHLSDRLLTIGGGLVLLGLLVIGIGLLLGSVPTAIQIIALLLVISGMLSLLAGYRIRQFIRPTGTVESSDETYELYAPNGPLVAGDLAGKPDYVLRLIKERVTVPVLMMKGNEPEEIAESVEIVADALCLLGSQVYGIRPPGAVLRYEDGDREVFYSQAKAVEVRRTVDVMHAAGAIGNLARTHDDPAICAACPVNAFCDQALA